MNEPNQRIHLLGQAPVAKALLTLGLPTMLGMLINALYNLVDTYFVGGLGTYPVGAITVAYPLSQIVVGLGLIFGNGAASYLSRLLGRGDHKQANHVASTALYSSLLVGAVVIALCMCFLRPLLSLFGASGLVIPYALAYTRIYLPASLCSVFNVTMNNLVSSEGAAQTTMKVLITGAVWNVLLDPLCIYQLGLGIAGAAIATALSQGISTLLYLRYLCKKRSIFQFHLKDCQFSGEIFGEILKIGIPTLIFQLLTSLSIAMINSRAGSYGDSALAAMGVVTKIMSLGSLMVFGFLKGLQPIAGYSYGARNYGRLRKVIQLSLLWSTLACVLFGLGMALASPQLMAQFTQGDQEMIQIGTAALRANGISFCCFGFYTVYSSLFLALGNARQGFLLGICRQGLCFLPAILLLPAIWQLNGVLCAQPVADVASALIAFVMAVGFHQTLKKPAQRDFRPQ